MPTSISESVYQVVKDKSKSELIDFIERQQVIINQLRSLDEPAHAEETMLLGYCPACGKRTDQAESPYRCRYCGKALIWNLSKNLSKKETTE